MAYRDDENNNEAYPHDREDPDTDDADWNLDPDTVACPYCRKEICEDAEWCHHCGKYISQEDAPGSRKPVWIFIGFALCVAIVLVWIL